MQEVIPAKPYVGWPSTETEANSLLQALLEQTYEAQQKPYRTKLELILKLQICECGHRRKDHEEEPPYLCYCPERHTTFRCACKGFEYRKEAQQKEEIEAT